MATKETTMQLVVAPIREIRADLRRNSRPILVIACLLLLYVFISAILYSLAEAKAYFLSLYFTIINVTTVGFGDIAPGTGWGRFIASINAFAGLLFFGVLVAAITLALQPNSYSGAITMSETSERNESAEIKANTELVRSLGMMFRAIEGIARARASEPERGNEKSPNTSNTKVHVDVAVRDHEDLSYKHILIQVDLHTEA